LAVLNTNFRCFQSQLPVHEIKNTEENKKSPDNRQNCKKVSVMVHLS